MKLKNNILAAAIILLCTKAVWAMPPYQGVQEPIWINNARKLGMDSPKDGLIQLLKSKSPDAKISGSRSYPVVLGYFSDSGSTYTKDTIQIRLFNTGTNVMSVNNYYRDMSYNAMSCSGSVASWVNSGHTLAYFGNGTNGLTYSDTIQSAYGFIKHTLVACDAVVDFSDPAYDQNSDGYVDVLWVVHAGRGGEEGSANDIWSHSWQLTGWKSGTGKIFTTNDPRPGYAGQYMKIDKYIIMPEKTLYANGAADVDLIGCGVFCHEFGHALGLPDLYDTGTDPYYGGPAGSGLGNWSLMAGGSWGGNGVTNGRPVALDVWSRRYLGWASPIRVTNNDLYTVNSTMTTASNSSYQLAKLGADTTKQFWLIENRYELGLGPVSSVRWDSLLPSTSPGGLAIYHIDSTYTTITYLNANAVNRNSTDDVNQNRPLGVALEETDMTTSGYSSELWSGANSGDAADIWNSGTQAALDSIGTAYPVTYLNGTTPTIGGAHTLVAVRSIPSASSAMSCSLLVGVIPVIPDINISLMQNPAFTYSLGISLVSKHQLLTPDNLDTANLTIDSDPPVRLDFSHPSASTFMANYTLQKAGGYTIRIASRDSDSVAVYRTGTRTFTVAAAKAAGGNLIALNGAVRLALPPGALTRDEFWVISEYEAVNPGALGASPAFQVGPTGRMLAASAGLILSYDPAALAGNDPAKLAVYELANGQWLYCGGQLDAVRHSVTAEISNAGVYQLCWDASNPILTPARAVHPHSASPSPFAQKTTISYQLGSTLPVSLKVYNISGQLVRTIFEGFQNAGAHTAVWDGRSDRNSKLPSGIYHYRLRIGNSTETGRMVKVQ